jgi:N-methylhydantoinase B
MLADDAVLNVRSDKRRFPPHGLFGGEPGTPSMNYLTHKGKDRLLPALLMETEPMMKGDRFRAILAGGGGYGDPFERDPDLVRADVSEEKLTIGYARKHYGVVIKPGPRFAIDKAATRKLRGRQRKRKVPVAAE